MLSVALKIFAHRKNGQQEFALVKHVDIEGVDGRAVLGRVARGL